MGKGLTGFNLDVLNEEVTAESKEEEAAEIKQENEALGRIEKAMGVEFSDEQRTVIQHSGKPLNVISCAGSGKTTVLVAKMMYRELVGGITPVNMLGITFSSAATSEIEQRYRGTRKKLRLRNTSMPTFKTFHSLFLMILRSIKGYKNHTVVSEGKYMFQLMKMVRSDGARDNHEIYTNIMSHRSSMINHGYSVDGIEGAIFEDVQFNVDNYNAIITKYNEMKEQDKVLDFDDMLVFLYKELIENECEEARESFRRVFHDIYIDEYQDISKVQLDIIDNLIGDESKLVAIGDDDQSSAKRYSISA